METKYTPGEWTVMDNVEVVQKETRSICTCWGFFHTPMEETNANAKLIAAAPNMFKALTTLWEDIETWSNLTEEQRELIDQAIKKVLL